MKILVTVGGSLLGLSLLLNVFFVVQEARRSRPERVRRSPPTEAGPGGPPPAAAPSDDPGVRRDQVASLAEELRSEIQRAMSAPPSAPAPNPHAIPDEGFDSPEAAGPEPAESEQVRAEKEALNRLWNVLRGVGSLHPKLSEEQYRSLLGEAVAAHLGIPAKELIGAAKTMFQESKKVNAWYGVEWKKLWPEELRHQWSDMSLDPVHKTLAEEIRKRRDVLDEAATAHVTRLLDPARNLRHKVWIEGGLDDWCNAHWGPSVFAED